VVPGYATAVRVHRILGPVVLGLLLLGDQPADAQDFDPGGRRRRRPPPAGAGRVRRPRKPPRRTKPDAAVLIKRYTSILLRSPEAAFPLQKLSELYRKRDGKLDALVTDFEKRAAVAGPDQLHAKLALAAIYQKAHRDDDARRLLQQAAEESPKLATPHLMLADLARRKSDPTTARSELEAARPLVKQRIDRERITRELMLLCVELEDLAAARRYHGELVRFAGGSLFVKKELGNALLARRKFAEAEKEFRAIVKSSGGDNRALAPALRDLGKALAKQKKLDEALKVLKRARRVAGSQAGIRAEILHLLTEVFREQGKLVELIAVLEAERGRDFQRLATIGSLYEETGQVAKAIATYRKALRLDGKNVDVRVKLVHLLQTAALLDEAIKEYERLIKAAPNNADFVFELAETMIQRGDRDKALKLVSDLERRTSREADILAAVADFYERIEEHKRALKVFERLSKMPGHDPQYVIDLGDRYFQQGDTKRALATWAKIRAMVPNRARASSILGEVYLEHDMSDKAIASFKEAIRLAPKKVRYRKQLAGALERTAGGKRNSTLRYRESLRMWEQILAEAGDDAMLEREARTHIVSLWSILRQLPGKVAPLRAKLNAKPPDLKAGRLLRKCSAACTGSRMPPAPCARSRAWRRATNRRGWRSSRCWSCSAISMAPWPCSSGWSKSIPSVRDSTTSAWPSTPPSCTAMTTPSSTRRARWSCRPTMRSVTTGSARCTGDGRTTSAPSPNCARRSARTTGSIQRTSPSPNCCSPRARSTMPTGCTATWFAPAATKSSSFVRRARRCS
jgi:tetratricopeptide (TPR) repeat protein